MTAAYSDQPFGVPVSVFNMNFVSRGWILLSENINSISSNVQAIKEVDETQFNIWLISNWLIKNKLK